MKILFLLLFFGLSVFTYGQTNQETCILTGLVYDDNGAVIMNAVIRIRGADKIEKIFKTNDEGAFEIKLKAGNYSIQVESPGFQIFRVDKFRVSASYKGKQNLDIALEVGPCSDCHMIEGVPIKKGKNRNNN